MPPLHSGPRFSLSHALSIVKCLLAIVGIPLDLPQIIGAQIADRIIAVRAGFSVRTLGPLTPTRIAGRNFRPTENQNTRHECPWLRMRVLHRDHYRCRACDKKGDEITLRIPNSATWLSRRDDGDLVCKLPKPTGNLEAKRQAERRFYIPPRKEDKILCSNKFR